MRGRLVIQKLIIEGPEYMRIFSFRDGLNIINGDKTSGKTLILSLIDYCLGSSSKVDLKVQKELGEKIDDIFLEFKIGNELITVKRKLKSNFNSFYIYFNEFRERSNYTPKVLERNEYLDFLLIHFEIPKYQHTKNKARSNMKVLETISFRDIMKFAYINQHDLGTDNFLDYKNINVKYKLGKTFEVINNLIKPDVNDLQNQKMIIQNEIQSLKSEIKGLETYLKDKELENLVEVDLRKANLELNILEYRGKKESLLRQITENKTKHEEVYSNIRRQILFVDNDIMDLEKSSKSKELSIASKHVLVSNYQKDLLELNATIETQYKLHNNEHTIICPICSSSLEAKSIEYQSVEVIQKSVKQVENKINLVSDIIKNEETSLIKSKKELTEKIDIKNILLSSLAKYEDNIRAPFISDLESLNKLIEQFTNRLNFITEAKRIHNKIVEMKKNISTLEDRIKNIDEKIGELEKTLAFKKAFFKKIDNDYSIYMNNFKINQYNDKSYISSNDYFPYYNDSIIFNHTSGGLLECVQIAYLISLLDRKVDDQSLNHPGFLMLDTIGKYLGTINTDDEINDPKVYEEIYKLLIDKSFNSQIIIVDNTPPPIANKYISYTFYSDGRGLVDISMNHLNSNNILKSLY